MKGNISQRIEIAPEFNKLLKLKAIEKGITKDTLIKEILAEYVGYAPDQAPQQPQQPAPRIKLMGE